jgi:uncharacterized protein YcaQ
MPVRPASTDLGQWGRPGNIISDDRQGVEFPSNFGTAGFMSSDELTLSEARRIALAAQGFGKPRPNGVRISHVRETIRRLGLLQIDYVNVLTPAHYQVLFSRLGPYRTTLLDELVFRRREFTEQWAHEASIIPIESWPLLRHRMETDRIRPWGFESVLERHAVYVEGVLDQIRQNGRVAAEDLSPPDGVPRRAEASWYSVPRAVLEAFFRRGVLAIAERRPNFARAFDLVERVVPKELHGRTVERAEAQRELLRQAARALGVGAAAELADYFRMSVTEARPRLAELVDAGELKRIRVEGWREPAYLSAEADVPARIEARALLSPFDPVVWFRPRAARLFDFDYRFEIFVPREKRRWGTYVLPFLSGDRLVARVDLKAERASGRLHVLAAFGEPNTDSHAVAEALATELRAMASWLTLDAVAVGRRGDLARVLRKRLRADQM